MADMLNLVAVVNGACKSGIASYQRELNAASPAAATKPVNPGVMVKFIRSTGSNGGVGLLNTFSVNDTATFEAATAWTLIKRGFAVAMEASDAV
jgi:hypothetical protein